MTTERDLSALLGMPLTTRPECESFITALGREGLLYHFDDGAVDCLHESNGKVTREQAEAIDKAVATIYAVWEGSGADMSGDCPIAFALTVLDA